MNYLESDLGHLGAGCAVKFALSGNAANVRLIDSRNFPRFKRGDRYEYLGGHATKSPVVLRTSHPDHWRAVVDLGGGRGAVNASISVIGE